MKAFKFHRSPVFLVVPMAGFLLMAMTGCATKALWNGEWVEGFHEPSSPTGIKLFETSERTDAIVQYDELTPWSDVPHKRCYYLNRNLTRIAARKEPRFAPPEVVRNRRMIPECSDGSDHPNAADERFVCVMIAETGTSFTLTRANGVRDGPYTWWMQQLSAAFTPTWPVQA
jgi:hypothetical protein